MVARRVMIVDDSVVMRRLLSDVLNADSRIDVVATAANGRIALAKLATLRVDVIVLDVEMPVLDGVQTVKELRRTDRRTPVIMFSALTERGAAATMDALAAGASDYVTKPANIGSVGEGRQMVRDQLTPRILALAGHISDPAPSAVVAAGARALTPSRADRPVPSARPESGVPTTANRLAGRPVAPRVVVIGCSTGGPEALTQVLSRLPADFPLPVAVVQHMPPVFTRLFAERLDRTCALSVTEAADGQPLLGGRVYLAPGDFHLELVGGPRGGVQTRLTKAAQENFCRPAVDVLFRSAVSTFGSSVLAVVLTGMGADGRLGSELLVHGGGRVLVQDKATSVVWGMPGAVATAGLADAVLKLDDIGPEIVHRTRVVTAGGTPHVPSHLSTAPTIPASVK
jgi:two-component system chemotaxis response regulator CheB